ncbi:substrate-binding domain-containing protein [Caballeronia sp. LZ062]|uniref:substrate-binding domain-containing protein n=1 Tax=unclassified Caballeronia TaxID=2646786 RepID=UPI00285D4BAF|nr:MULTISPECIES: substrate-binding domain-containing protein [unclassified Caballeronia]MDR5856149.1 substrate-binding domain-containing protein [Caballeronia sp. LZ050]MDR5872820.1 substrate-binding domain-containing protein [Caballeronia sp. LZ062]
MNDNAAPITVISSMATRQVLSDLADAYMQHAGPRVTVESVGGVAAARRVKENEAFDVVVLASDAIARLAEARLVDAWSRVRIARSGIAMAVAAGAARPLIDSGAAVREAVLGARSIGYSTGPSGTHLMRMFERWGIAERVGPRIVQAQPGVPVGALIARGEVELGFQQMSELIGLDGVDIVGPLPDEIQALTVFEGAVCMTARSPGDAKALLAFLGSPQGDGVKRRYGMEPVACGNS